MDLKLVSSLSIGEVLVDVLKNRQRRRQSNVIWGEEGNMT